MSFRSQIETLKTTLPMSRERSSGSGIEFVLTFGLDPTQESFVKNILKASRLPMDNVRSIRNRTNDPDSKDHLGLWDGRELSVYKLLGALPPISQLGTLLHEAGHAVSPDEKRNNVLYGSEANRVAALNLTREVAQRTLVTGKYLNGYHHHLCDEFELYQETQGVKGIPPSQFIRETWSILLELRHTNPKHLKEVLLVQSLKAKMRGYDQIGLVSDQKADELMGVLDVSLSRLKGIYIDQLDEHIEALKDSLPTEATPLSDIKFSSGSQRQIVSLVN